MSTSKRPRKTTKRSPKKKTGKKAALIRFTATQTGTARPSKRAADGDVWVLIGPISWIKYTPWVGVEYRTKQAAVKALKKFRKG